MTLKDQLLDNADILVGMIQEFPDDYFNLKPDEESWSAAEVLEHIYRSEFGITYLFNGETSPLKDREPDAHVPEIKHRFLDSDTKMKSFGIINPTEGEKTKKELITKFRDNRLAIAGLIQEQSLDELCLKYENPLFGYMTRLEWLHFIMIHTERHMKQIERIKKHHQI